MQLSSRLKLTDLQAKIIRSFSIICGLYIFVTNLFQIDLGIWRQVLVFALLSFLAQLMPTRLPQGADFSVAFIIDLVLISLYGTSITIVTRFIVTSISLLASNVLGHRESIFKVAAATGQAVLVVGLAGTINAFVSDLIFAFIITTIIYFLAVTYFLALESCINSNQFFRATWFSVMQTLYLNFFVLSSLAYLLTYVMRNATMEWKIFSVLLFFVPVMLVSHAFRLSVNIKQSYLNTVKTMVKAIEAKDPYTRGHSERVAELTIAAAKELRFSARELQKLEYVALLHDSGKIGIPEDILNKPTTLSHEEFEQVKKHSVLGAEIVQKIKFLSNNADIVLHHHEKYDGTGYPAGLRGEEIPLEARIMAIADAYDAMTTDRPFRSARTPQEAVEEIARLSGRQFDPRLVEVFKTVQKRRGVL